MKFKKILFIMFISFFVFALVSCDASFMSGPDTSNLQLKIQNAETKEEIKGTIVLEGGTTIKLEHTLGTVSAKIEYIIEGDKGVLSIENNSLVTFHEGHAKVTGKITYKEVDYTASFDVIVASFDMMLKDGVTSVEKGQEVLISYAVNGTNAAPSFSSSNPEVLEVVNGKVKGISEGQAKLIGELNVEGVTLRKEITVRVTETVIETFTVTFKDSDQSVIAEVVVEKGHAAEAPEDPERLGYVFTGWSADFSNVVRNMTTVARYRVVEYDIYFFKNSNSNDIQMPNNMKYTVESEITLPTPVAPFRFLGWYDNPECQGDPIAKINKGTVEEIDLYAKWDENDFLYNTITYVYEDGKPVEHACQNINEFADQFFKELYEWSGSTKSLADFRSEALAKWKSGAEYSAAKVYCNGSENLVLEGYFVHDEDNFKRWMPWMIEFDKQVNNINHEQSAWGSTYVGYLRLYALIMQSASYWTQARMEPLYTMITVPEVLPVTFESGEEFDIPDLFVDDGRTFLGWVDDSGNHISKITKDMKGNIVLYATWSNSIAPESFTITQPARIEKYDSYQLEWTFTPENTTNKRLNFISSDPSILSISNKGVITTYKEGVVTVTVEVLADASFNKVFNIEVYVNPFIDGKYTNSSILNVNDTEVLQAVKYNFTDELVWTSSDDSIAIVNDGVVTAKKAGYATITVKSINDENIKFEYGITVSNNADEFQIIETAHNQDSFIRRDLNVAYAYLTDVIISASDLLYNWEYTINRDYEAIQAQHSENHSGERPSTEFITVHYTAGYQKSSTAKATASYFANGGSSSSIHYTTGNDGIYHILDDSLIGWHAGDGAGEASTFYWINTGVKAPGYVKPIWGVVRDSSSSSGYYFTLNGQATTIVVPTTGKSSSGSNMVMKDPSKCFTYFGPAWKVVDGYYYMGNTWACFTQTLAGAISSRGGNRNSVGIESACNQGSDLWYTYQITAQLVAHLLQTYNLDYYRVVGHNAFSGKDCPQTLLANGGELWELFMDCVRREHELLTTMSDYTITCVSHNPELLQDNGRILAIPKYSTSVSYTVTVVNNTTKEAKSETFSTIIHGWYTE